MGIFFKHTDKLLLALLLTLSKYSVFRHCLFKAPSRGAVLRSDWPAASVPVLPTPMDWETQMQAKDLLAVASYFVGVSRSNVLRVDINILQKD